MFNYTYKDDERPIIRGLYLINENNSLVRNSPIRKKVKKINDSTYTVDDFEYNGKIGIGLDIYDIQYKNLYNQNGVYKVELFIDFDGEDKTGSQVNGLFNRSISSLA